MVRRPSFRPRRVAQGLTGVLCLALLACSGGGDATAPNDGPPVTDPGPPTHEPPVVDPGPDQPPPPPPQLNVIGDYGLTQINDGQPEHTVLLSNPDGKVIGLYRFDRNSVLRMTDQAWAFSIVLSDEKNVYEIDNQGTFTRSGDQGRDVTFVSELDDKVFSGRATDGSMVFTYDLDGDGAPDTKLGFIRTNPQ